MRSVVSYDDLEQVNTAPIPALPPAKKRRRQQNKRKSSGLQKFAHWDDPVENLDASLANYNYPGDRDGEATDVESRELTHEEIWDDSALIEAWDAAMDEYKAFHESEKGWKIESVSKHSPLWYNTPPSASSTASAGSGSNPLSSTQEKKQDHTIPVAEHDSVPSNFNTFIPSHDHTLPNLATTGTQDVVEVSRDEAFRNALNAMYWAGYWTAAYYRHGVADELVPEEADGGVSSQDEAEGPDMGGTMDEFVTSQR